MRSILSTLLLVAVASLTSCKGVDTSDAVRIGSKSLDLFNDIKTTAAKAKASAKAAQDVQPTAMLHSTLENDPPVKFKAASLPAVCAFDPGPPSGLPVTSSDGWRIAFTALPSN